jgi:parallel beta-helix repeat protein
VLRPGDILYIKQGTYTEALIHNIPRGNSWTQAVTIAAYPGHVVTLRPSGTGSVLRFIEPQQYIIVRGLVLDAGGVAGDVVKITSSGSGSAAHHIRIDDCEVKNGTMNGIMTTDGAHSNEFIGLDVHDNGRSDFNHGMYLSTDSNLVEGSDVHANAGWGIHIYSAYGSTSNNVVRRNRLYNNARVGGRGSGVLVSSGSGHQVYNNLVWGNYAGIDAWSRAQNVLIANNVVYANRWVGIFVVSGAVNTRVQNNITWQNGDGDDYANQGSGTTQNFNLIGVDPHFVNADGADFHLRSDSPAIDRGTAISSVTVDYDGVSRPQHNAVDIGAFEWR